MFVSQVRCADAGANAGLLDTINWAGLLNTLNFNTLNWGTANKWNEDQRKKRTCEPLRQFGGYFPEMPVDHVNTSEAQRREALATLRADDSEGSDGGGVGGSMVGGSMVGGAMEGGAMVGGGDGGGSGGVRSEAPALAAVARTTATIKHLQALEQLIKGEGEFAATLSEVRSGSGSFKTEYQDGFLKWMQCIDIQVNRPATLCKQCAIYSLQCVADSLGTACQRRVLVISI